MVGDFSNTDNLYLVAGSLKRSQSQGNPTEDANILVHGEGCRVSELPKQRGVAKRALWAARAEKGKLTGRPRWGSRESRAGAGGDTQGSSCTAWQRTLSFFLGLRFGGGSSFLMSRSEFQLHIQTHSSHHTSPFRGSCSNMPASLCEVCGCKPVNTPPPQKITWWHLLTFLKKTPFLAWYKIFRLWASSPHPLCPHPYDCFIFKKNH